MLAARWRTICRISGRCIRIRASSVTSCALETWPGASRPSGRAEWGPRRPSCRARRFISATKRASFPLPTWSASASAASFALWISAASSSSRTVRRSPGWRFALDSPTPAAWRLTVTTSDGFVRSTVRRTVISFVMLAIGTRASALRAASTSPVTPFSTTKARAPPRGGAASTGAASARAAAAKRRPFKRCGSLFHPDALADGQVRRLDAGVQGEQLLDRRVELDRHVAERLAHPQAVEATTLDGHRVRGRLRLDGLRAQRRGRRGGVARQAGADEQDGDRRREQEGGRCAVALRLP